MENHTDIETLLTKYFEGKTTPPENEQIEAWLNADEEHLHIARQLNTLYLAVDTQHITKKIDTEKALDKVKSKTKVRNLSWWGWTQRIAAILSVPLLIGRQCRSCSPAGRRRAQKACRCAPKEEV